MTFAVIGDPHGEIKKLNKLKQNLDFILITGDLPKSDEVRKWFFDNIERKKKGLEPIKKNKKLRKLFEKEAHDSTINIMKQLLKIAPVYTIEGNAQLPKKTKTAIKKLGVKIVKNQIRIINNYRIGFLEFFIDVNWVKDFKPKDKELLQDAKLEEKFVKNLLKRFKNLDYLVCHQPPYGVLDKVNFKGAPKEWQGKRAGSKIILNFIKKEELKAVFCGHIHEGEGKKKIGKTIVYNLGISNHQIFK